MRDVLILPKSVGWNERCRKFAGEIWVKTTLVCEFGLLCVKLYARYDFPRNSLCLNSFDAAPGRKEGTSQYRYSMFIAFLVQTTSCIILIAAVIAISDDEKNENVNQNCFAIRKYRRLWLLQEETK